MMDSRDYPEAYLTDELESYGTMNHAIDKAAARIKKLEAENAALKADAERYRWVRDARTGPCQIWETVCEPDGTPLYCSLKHSEELDAAIDDAIAKERS